jgi:hypothetical protein
MIYLVTTPIDTVIANDIMEKAVPIIVVDGGRMKIAQIHESQAEYNALSMSRQFGGVIYEVVGISTITGEAKAGKAFKNGKEIV